MMLVVLGLVAGLLAAPANVKGRWDGKLTAQTPDGGTREDTVLLILDQTDGTITGTVGGSETDQHPITSGSVQEKTVILRAKHSTAGHEYHLELTVGNDEMRGTVKSGGLTGQVEVKKRKG